MKKACLGVVCLVAAFSLAVKAADVIPGRLVIEEMDGVRPAQVAMALAAHPVSRAARVYGRISVIEVPEESIETTRASLQRTGLFRQVERDYWAHTAGNPNDPSFSSQWHLATIQAPAAWNMTTGSSGITIAIIDSGADATHPDLAPRLVAGWNFLTNSSNTQDVVGHGTAVSGTIAAATNNGIGVAGVTWSNPIMPLVVVDSTNYASYSNIAAAIDYAADHGARIINVSIGGTSSSSTLQSAVSYAWSKGAVVFAAAMNNSSSSPNYPAACTNAVAVSATDSTDTLASFSDYGSWIALSAPGVNILTTTMGGGYQYWSGTSFSSPIAAGVAALALSANPSLSPAALVGLLETNSDDLGPAGFDQNYGWGRVNAYKAVLAANPSISSIVGITITPEGTTLNAGQVQQFSAAVTGTSNTGVAWSVYPSTGTVSASGLYTAPSFVSVAQTVVVTATSAADGTKSASATINLNSTPVVQSTGAATLVATDTTTEGNWKGKYGGDGYNVFGDTINYPAYVTVTPSGNAPWTWAASTSDPRALTKASTSTTDIASCWYSAASFSIDLNFHDQSIHQVAFYFLDWDYRGARAERVDVLDGNNNVLDTRSLSGFGNGQYWTWNLSGHVIVRVTNTTAINAVMSGVFFGTVSAAPPPPPPSSTGAAQFIKADTTTQGSWKGVYGLDGYNVINDSSSYPSYVTPSPSGNQAWTWVSSSGDVRDLQKGSIADRLAACWYSASSFTISMAFKDQAAHQVALYFLDWDHNGPRTERVDILDSNNNVLDTRSLANFGAGQYLVWNLTGTVTIRITNAGYSNAVLSGIFLR
jgi:thermitase